METLYDVQEWFKRYGYINLMAERKDAIFFMQQELQVMHEKGLLLDDDKDFLTISLILKREARIEIEKMDRKEVKEAKYRANVTLKEKSIKKNSKKSEHLKL